MSDLLLAVITLASMLLVIYHHVGYPLVLRWIGQRMTVETESEIQAAEAPVDAADAPSVCVVIPAYNERAYIADKIRNLAALDYPEDCLKVIVACDGCSDGTASLAVEVAAEPECAHLNLEVRDFPDNRGKVAVINDVLRSVDSQLVAFSDVSALISVDALHIVARRFQDPHTGVLSGHYRLLRPGSHGEAAYWRYQGQLKAREAVLGSTLGAPGAFYVIRRALFQPLPADTINDDFVLPMQIVAAGHRAVYAPGINALELEQGTDAMDHARRRRIAAGNVQQLVRLRGLLLPRHGGVAFAFASGKGLRVLMPYLMLVALLGSWLLAADSWWFALCAIAQSCLYVLAGVVHFLQPERVPRHLRTLSYLVGGHLAGLIGSLRYLAGRDRGRWKRVGC